MPTFTSLTPVPDPPPTLCDFFSHFITLINSLRILLEPRSYQALVRASFPQVYGAFVWLHSQFHYFLVILKVLLGVFVLIELATDLCQLIQVI